MAFHRDAINRQNLVALTKLRLLGNGRVIEKLDPHHTGIKACDRRASDHHSRHMNAKALHLVFGLGRRDLDGLRFLAAPDQNLHRVPTPQIADKTGREARCLIPIDCQDAIAGLEHARPLAIRLRHNEFTLSSCGRKGNRNNRRRRVLALAQ